MHENASAKFSIAESSSLSQDIVIPCNVTIFRVRILQDCFWVDTWHKIWHYIGIWSNKASIFRLLICETNWGFEQTICSNQLAVTELFWLLYVKKEEVNWIIVQKLTEWPNIRLTKILKNHPLTGSALRPPIISISSKRLSLINLIYPAYLTGIQEVKRRRIII